MMKMYISYTNLLFNVKKKIRKSSNQSQYRNVHESFSVIETTIYSFIPNRDKKHIICCASVAQFRVARKLCTTRDVNKHM